MSELKIAADRNKVLKVINSCQTEDHIEVAAAMVENFNKLHLDKSVHVLRSMCTSKYYQMRLEKIQSGWGLLA